MFFPSCLQYATFSGVLVWLHCIREFQMETVHPTGILRLHESHEVRWGEGQLRNREYNPIPSKIRKGIILP
jgi:hypothetical protein